ncbi:hypothetical protein H1R20_g9841, partial [Candolleomyces eurysporus]
MDAWEIDYQVKNAFSTTEVGQKHPEYFNGWRLLLDLSQGHGSRALLQPMDGKEGGVNISYHDIFYARIPAHRQAKSQFKCIIHIFLPPGCPNITVPGLPTLVIDFGSVDDYQQITEAHLLVGQFGINAMIEKYFDYLLDNMALDHPNYLDLYDLFQTFALALTCKISNFKKSHGKRSQAQGLRADTPIINEEEEPSTKRKTCSTSASGNKGT